MSTNGYFSYSIGYFLLLPKFKCWQVDAQGNEVELPDD
jgi:hypothetical protein